MKRFFKTLALCSVAFIGLCTFTISKTLTNEEHRQTLSLYQDGKCVISGPNFRGTGTYDIKGSTIYFTWDNGAVQQGKYLPTGSYNRTPRVCVEGVCYDAGRAVRSR